tara:strand:- start:272 stop:439 length:168 start_codon:yes stop_codon:yes gene_type:complete
MFGIFKKKSTLEKLEEKYKKLLEEAYKLSSTNRTLGDSKTAEANNVLKEIESIKQ